MNIGEKINQIWQLREQHRKLTADDKDVKAGIAELERDIINELESQGLFTTHADKAMVTLTEMDVPSITDWDTFLDWVKETESWYMLSKSVSASAYREALASGINPPGIEPFTKKSLSIRTK